jgi:[ribosomal protein S5]-alanine N-acetyltransferase
MFVISTRRLLLRRFVTADAILLNAVFGDPDVMRYGIGPQSEAWVRRWIDQRIAEYEPQGFGVWAIVLKELDRVIGYCGLTRFDDVNGSPEIELGYRLAKEFWGRGLGTEAATAVREFAIQQLGLPRVVSLVDPANARSIRVAEKLGMVHTDDVLLPGYSYPDRVYTYTRANR